MSDNVRIGVVIVTYNRIEHLRHSIYNYIGQTQKPKHIVIVDNASTDGTHSFLEEWEKTDDGIQKEVIFLPENIGGSGGFNAGLAQMLKHQDVDWIWVADDDAYPDLDAFEKAEEYIKKISDNSESVSAICGGVGTGGKYSGIQRFYLKKTIFGIQEMPIPYAWYQNRNGFEIDMYSFVGTLMKRENLIKAGLPRKDFFIYQDDLEHALRMRKTGRIICTTSINITHKDNSAPAREASWRDYYATRNIISMYKEHFDRWSLFCRICRRIAATILSLNTKKMKIVFVGIADGLKGNMGIHPVYKPGYKA